MPATKKEPAKKDDSSSEEESDDEEDAAPAKGKTGAVTSGKKCFQISLHQPYF